MRSCKISVFVAALAISAVPVFPALAQGPPLPSGLELVNAQRQYPVKFVCGQTFGPTAPLVDGFYATAINVHNPNPHFARELLDFPSAPGGPPIGGDTGFARPVSRPIRLGKKVAVARPGQEVGEISPFEFAVLRNNEAFEIDCEEIRRLAGTSATPPPPGPPGPIGFLTGFVVIVSEAPLDVQAVYTARPSTGQVSTMHVEWFFGNVINEQVLAIQRRE